MSSSVDHAMASSASNRRRSVVIAGRRLPLSPVFDTYWHFATARQQVYFARLRGTMPHDVDPILTTYRFTNCYRAADRVSQFGIAQVAYGEVLRSEDVAFRILLYKLFNKIDTWCLLDDELGPISWRRWRPEVARAVLDAAWQAGRRLYSPAYVIPPPRLGGPRKHHDHLALLEAMMRDGVAAKIQRAQSLKEVFELLCSYRSIGTFLAYQFAIDLNYSELVDFSEDEFVAAGPGARDGIRKCFGPAATGIEESIIRWMVDVQEKQFERQGLSFPTLGGRRLHLIDCQNLFCEVDKYARVAHPQVHGHSGRSRIKQQYRPDPAPLPLPWFPPKWGITDTMLAAITRPEFGSE